MSKRVKIYNYKHPENKVPINFYLGGLDLSEPLVYYVYLCTLVYFGISMTGIAAFRLPTLGIMSIHIKGNTSDYPLGKFVLK